MWCRALLVAIALTCTFHREISAEPDGQSTPRIDQIKDVICVLLMSGYKKEDLDANLLKKLRRLNVNIDDMNNEKCIQKSMLSSITRKPGQNISITLVETVPTKSDQIVQASITRVHKVINNFTETTKAIEKSQKNKNQTILEIAYTRNKDSPNILNVENMWKMFGKVKPPFEDEIAQLPTTKMTDQKPLTRNEDTKNNSQAKSLDFINKIFFNYLATMHTATPMTTTTTKNYADDFSQKLKEFFDNNTDYYRRALLHHLPEVEKKGIATGSVPLYLGNKELFTYKNGTMKHFNELLRQNAELNISSPLENNSKVTQQLSSSQTVSQKLEIITDSTVKPEVKWSSNVTEIKLISDNIIKEITEKIKASILNELQKEITSTTPKTIQSPNTTETANDILKSYQENINNATSVLLNLTERFHKMQFENIIENRTEIYSSTTSLPLDQDSIRVATQALEKFMELFKTVRDGVMPLNPKLNYKITQKKDTKNEFHGPINVLYPPLVPAKYAYGEQGVSVMPVFVHLNRPDETRQTYNNPRSRLDEQHIIQSAHIMQTDAALVPVIGIPVPKSIKAINQNIIVTTKHPMDQIREDFQHPSYKKITNWPMNYGDYTRYYDSDKGRISGLDKRYTDTEMNSESERERYRTDVERSYGHTYKQRQRYSLPRVTKTSRGQTSKRGKQSSNGNNYYKKYISNMKPQILIQKDNFHPIFPQEHFREKYHVKLERPKELSTHNREHSTTVTRDDKRLKVASRQQLSLSDLKKKARASDSHFRNFLKSQQKVNEMLEKILATKGPDRGRSADTTDPFYEIL